jgi:hypothetical protein
MAKVKKAKSPYQKYGKSPFVYSETYRQWKAATKAGRKDEADRHARQHRARFGGSIEEAVRFAA